jgi:hypothetical protein
MAPAIPPEEHGAEEARTPRLLRLRVRLHARRLDRELAAGARPDATPELRQRAGELTEAKERRHIAGVLDRIRAEAEGPRRPFESAAPLARDAICGCGVEIKAILDRLESGAALRPRGIAGVAALLHDDRGALSRPETSESELREALASIIRELGAR